MRTLQRSKTQQDRVAAGVGHITSSRQTKSVTGKPILPFQTVCTTKPMACRQVSLTYNCTASLFMHVSDKLACMPSCLQILISYCTVINAKFHFGTQYPYVTQTLAQPQPQLFQPCQLHSAAHTLPTQTAQPKPPTLTLNSSFTTLLHLTPFLPLP